MRSRASLTSVPVCCQRASSTATAWGCSRAPPRTPLQCVGGDVVMGRADAAGGEDIGAAGAQRIHRLEDGPSSSSATTRTSIRSIPRSVQKPGDDAILTSVRPERISSPMTIIPAVTRLSGWVMLLDPQKYGREKCRLFRFNRTTNKDIEPNFDSTKRNPAPELRLRPFVTQSRVEPRSAFQMPGKPLTCRAERSYHLCRCNQHSPPHPWGHSPPWRKVSRACARPAR